jgi:CRP-like cAMP-binding protein
MDVEQVRGLSPFEGISEAGLERVAACAAEVTREAGEVRALPDDPGQGMYVIREGTVAVELRSGTIELGPGDFFGELALLVEARAAV